MGVARRPRTTLNFPDLTRIRHVKEALWRQGAGGASVMVGSGFSRNAEMKTPGARPPPDWSEIANAMHTKLHPSTATNGPRARARAVDALAIAQEYSDEFGRAELHGFLREQVRDDDMEPADLHRRLLALPWADVFTTNWDTLLEKTRELTIKPTYSVVRAVHELPLAKRPRIVKLHGSLPAQFPLIATKEDYRKYPRQYAAFVNTAQQAMMETLFVLLGFSGDDPNFTSWSEWVRKELGPWAPKIYLAGWLDLTPAARQRLEKKGVVPIDLAGHPKQLEWRRQQMEHRFATEWLLTTLELGERYSLEEWPKALPPPGNPVPAYLEPVDTQVWAAPGIAAELPKEDENDEPDEEAVDSVVSVWAENRELYPGWLVLPEHVRRELREHLMRELREASQTEKVAGDFLDAAKEDRVIAGLTARDMSDRVRIVNEIVWRREMRAEPMGEELALAAKNLVEEVVANTEGLERRELDRGAVRHISMALVTHARFRFNRCEFDDAVRIASEFAQHDANALHALEYEKCLWALYDCDLGALAETLDAWSVEAGDPFWVVRKASLMFEADHRSEQAVPLMKSAVLDLRRSSGYSLAIGALSRESWAAYLARKLATRSWSDADGSDPHRARTRELAGFNCDPPSEIRALTNAVERREERRKGPGFELGEGASTQRGFDPEETRNVSSKAKASYRLVRLAEVVGLPPLSDRWPPTKAMLGHASEWLYRDGQVEFALRLMLRVTTYEDDDLVRRLLSRPNLATMPDDVVDSITALCERTIDHFTERGVSGSHMRGTASPIERVRVAMEILARLALRLKPERAVEVLRRGLAIYENPLFYGSVLLRSAIRHLLSRSWEAMRTEERMDMTLDLLAAPIAGVEGYSPNPFAFLDPGELIDGEAQAMPERDEANNEEWVDVVRFLIRALACGEDARSRAMLRLVNIALVGRLTADEEAGFAAAIWSGGSGEEGLPGEKTLRHWVYLSMPAERTGVAEAWFRQKWMSAVDLSEVDDETLDNMLFHTGDLKEESQRRELSFEFTEADQECIVGVLRKWAATSPPRWLILSFDQELLARVRNGIRGAATLLMHVDVPAEVAEALYAKYEGFVASEVPAMPLLVGLVRSLEDRESEIGRALRKGFSSRDSRVVSNSAVATQFWLYFAGRGMVRRPPVDLIREVGVIISTGRVDSLGAALWLAQWVFTDGEERDQDELRELAVEGLASLVSELEYGRTFPDDVDVSLLRWRCVGLARAMRDRGREEEAVKDWLDVAKRDPLPELWHKVSNIAA